MINLELTIDNMNKILNALAAQPYIEVAGLITEITNQAKKQIEESEHGEDSE